MYHAEAYVGLDKDFMLKAHLLVPEGYENTLYTWLLNFQIANEEYTEMYKDSLVLDEGTSSSSPIPITILRNIPMVWPCSMPNTTVRQFSKCVISGNSKGTLTLAWTIAERNGYTPCHGGQKRFNLPSGNQKVIDVFGLSGSEIDDHALGPRREIFDDRSRRCFHHFRQGRILNFP